MTSGTITFGQHNIKFLHSACYFDSCSRTSHGGVIYFNCQSSIVQHRFCTIKPSIPDHQAGAHSYCYVSSNKQNIISECSTSQAFNEYIHGMNYNYYGNCRYHASNSSKNTIEQEVGFWCECADEPTKFNFSTFEDNIAYSYTCFYLHSNGKFYGDHCNFVKCTLRNSDGIIYCNTELILSDSTIIGPYGSGNAFASGNTNTKFNIYNCNIDPFSTLNGIYTTSNIFQYHQTNALAFLSTYGCHADIMLKEMQYGTKIIKLGLFDFLKDKYGPLFVFVYY